MNRYIVHWELNDMGSLVNLITEEVFEKLKHKIGEPSKGDVPTSRTRGQNNACPQNY